ncbi:MAG: hypothetical protein ACRCXT_16380 [Paraclostridium sp.]
MNSNKNFLNISGTGKYPGGEFDEINISGTGKLEGDVDCNRLDVSGMGKVIGNLKSNRISVDGTLKISKKVEVEKISVNGILKCESDVKARKVDISGVYKIEGNLKCDSIYGIGVLKIKSDIECENIKINGKLKCDGLVNCERFELTLSNVNSGVKELGASYINIEEDSSGWKIFSIFKKRSNFKADVIEGDNITLENCEARVVRGKNIEIGKNCNIKNVEYSGSIKIDPKSKVEKSYKI